MAEDRTSCSRRVCVYVAREHAGDGGVRRRRETEAHLGEMSSRALARAAACVRAGGCIARGQRAAHHVGRLDDRLFAARLGFSISDELLDACGDADVHAALAQKVSRERVGAELERMLGPLGDPVRALALVYSLGLAGANAAVRRDVILPLEVAQQRRAARFTQQSLPWNDDGRGARRCGHQRVGA